MCWCFWWLWLCWLWRVCGCCAFSGLVRAYWRECYWFAAAQTQQSNSRPISSRVVNKPSLGFTMLGSERSKDHNREVASRIFTNHTTYWLLSLRTRVQIPSLLTMFSRCYQQGEEAYSDTVKLREGSLKALIFIVDTSTVKPQKKFVVLFCKTQILFLLTFLTRGKTYVDSWIDALLPFTVITFLFSQPVSSFYIVKIMTSFKRTNYWVKL